jgi:hypothetical protein
MVHRKHAWACSPQAPTCVLAPKADMLCAAFRRNSVRAAAVVRSSGQAGLRDANLLLGAQAAVVFLQLVCVWLSSTVFMARLVVANGHCARRTYAFWGSPSAWRRVSVRCNLGAMHACACVLLLSLQFGTCARMCVLDRRQEQICCVGINPIR